MARMYLTYVSATLPYCMIRAYRPVSARIAAFLLLHACYACAHFIKLFNLGCNNITCRVNAYRPTYMHICAYMHTLCIMPDSCYCLHCMLRMLMQACCLLRKLAAHLQAKLASETVKHYRACLPVSKGPDLSVRTALFKLLKGRSTEYTSPNVSPCKRACFSKWVGLT